MYNIIFPSAKHWQFESFDTRQELLNFVNGLSFDEVINSHIFKGKKIQLIKTEKGWTADGTL